MEIKLWLAPLHGITYYYFRNILFQHERGIDTVIAPFMSVQSTENLNPKKWQDLLPENNPVMSPIPQLMGNNASDFKDTILALKKLDYQQFNWNIGCPIKQITKRKRGCGIMPYPEMIENVIANSIDLGLKISVKMRLGMDKLREGVEIIKRLNHYPLDFIVLHPRLGIQQYEGKVDLDAARELIGLSKHPVVYSGDISNIADFEALIKQIPEISQIMLGRGILKNPFLAEEIKEIKKNEDKDLHRFILYYQDLSSTLISLKGKYALGNLKELWHYFSYYLSLEQDKLKNLLRIKKLELFVKEADKILKLYFFG